MYIRKDKGITLMALIITIVVLLILASVTIYSGKEAIKKAKLEELKTNMLLIKAKTKEYVEQASFKNGVNNEGEPKQEALDELKGKQEEANQYTYIELEESQYLYDVTNDLKDMGLKDIEILGDEKYLVKYDIKNVEVEVYNTQGYNGKYSLTDIEKE